MREIDIKVEINKITSLSPIREKAFFTIMRQSGLKPHTIKELKIKDVEQILQPNTPTPCKITIPQQKHLAFIGNEAINYIKQYLETRKKRETLTPNSLLFTTHNNPKKEINTKNVSRTFKQAIRKLHLPNELQLSSLTKFYIKNTEEYRTHQNHNTRKDDETYRELYEKYAMPSLEIEPITPHQMHQLQNKLNNIEHLFLEESADKRGEWLEEYSEDEYGKWLEEHPEEAKQVEEESRKNWETHEKWLEEHPQEAELQDKEDNEAQEYLIKLHMEDIENELKEVKNRLKKIENIVREKKSVHRK
jgi:hypothetical protein